MSLMYVNITCSIISSTQKGVYGEKTNQIVFKMIFGSKYVSKTARITQECWLVPRVAENQIRGQT